MTKPILALLIVSVFAMFCAKKEEPVPAPAVVTLTPEVVLDEITPAPTASVTIAPVPTAVAPAECAEGAREFSYGPHAAGRPGKPECRECRGGKWHKCKS